MLQTAIKEYWPFCELPSYPPHEIKGWGELVNLRQLKYFVAIVEAGNMTRAAEQLRVAQTALGMQIRQLEEDLGVALLTRHSRGVEPTKAGKLLHARALTILKLTEETRKDVSACEREESESIRLGNTPALMLI